MTSYFAHYHPAKTEAKPNQHLEIEVRHSEGGVSFYDGRHRRRGLVVGIQLMDVEFDAQGRTRCRSFMLFGNEIAQAFHVTTLMRRDVRRAAKLVDFVKANLAEIARLAMAKDFAALDTLLTRFELHDRHPALV